MIKTYITDLDLKNKNAISHPCSQKLSGYLQKSRLIFNVSYYRHTTQKFVHSKMNTCSNKMNAYKDFHAFACMSIIMTCLIGLVLKYKNAQH